MLARTALFALVILASLGTANLAHAECQEPESGWSFNGGAHFVEPEGTLIIAGQFLGNIANAPNDVTDFVMRRVTDDTEVAGTFEYVTLANHTRVQWTPSESLEVGEQLYGNAFGMDWEQFNVEIVESVAAPTASVDRLTRREIEFIEQQRCCDVDYGECQNPCSSECIRCGIEAFTYPVLPEFDIAIESAGLNDQWGVFVQPVQSDGETPFDSDGGRIVFASSAANTLYGAELPADTTDFCVRFEVQNLLTEEVVTSDVVCATDPPLYEASRRDTSTLDTSLCIGGTVDVFQPDGTVEKVPIDEVDQPENEPGDTTGEVSKPESGGCAVGGGHPGVMLLMFAIVGFRRRRRRRTGSPTNGAT